MNLHAMEAYYNKLLDGIEHIINIQSGDDPDLKQEGLLGAYLALNRQPTATDQYLLNNSCWELVSIIRKRVVGQPLWRTRRRASSYNLSLIQRVGWCLIW